MNSRAESNWSDPVDLPTYHALLIVDMKDFSGTQGRRHAELTEEIPRILRDAFKKANLAEMLDDVRFQETTGDGYVLGFRSAVLPYLINPLLAELQDELAYRNRAVRAGQASEVIRMRVSINVGPATLSGKNKISDGSGNMRIETHRLLDATPVRDLLTRSTDATCVAAIVSARAYEDAVLSGYAADDPGLYVEAPVQVKSYEGMAYLRVPCPTGDLLKHGFRPPDNPTGTRADAPEPRPDLLGPGNSVGDIRGRNTVIQGGNVRNRSIAQSVNNVYKGTIHGPVNSGSGDQVNGPMHFGKGDQYNAPTPKRRREDRGGQ
jgi:class 3 adenylate cyclase